MPSQYLNVRQTADYLNVTVRWVYDHIAEIPHRRFGGQLRFTVAELDQWADAQRYAAL